MCLLGASAFFMYNCHSDDRREEESREHKVGATEILRFISFRSE